MGNGEVKGGEVGEDQKMEGGAALSERAKKVCRSRQGQELPFCTAKVEQGVES